MSFLAFSFIVASLLSFVVAQFILKRAMESTTTSGFRNLRFVSLVSGGIALMTISFFLTLGLLQRFDLSYLYPFQGLSVIFITLMAAVPPDGAENSCEAEGRYYTAAPEKRRLLMEGNSCEAGLAELAPPKNSRAGQQRPQFFQSC